MLSPASKGWINKYFDLVEKRIISLNLFRPENMRKLHFMHLTLSNSGIVYGHPLTFIFAKSIDTKDWTNEEKLKFLLFESHLFIYLQVNNKSTFERKKFIIELCDFYQNHGTSSITQVFSFFIKESVEEKVEKILSKRVEIKVNVLENKWWVNSLNNAFSFLDVILFDDFLHKEKDEALNSYELFSYNAMIAVILSANADGEIQTQERSIFNVFLASANLDEKKREELKLKFENGTSLEDFSFFVKNHWLLKRYLVDLSILTAVCNDQLLDEEREYLIALCSKFEIPLLELDENLAIAEHFLLLSQNKVEYLKDNSSYKKVYSSLTKRWGKIILRNKEKLSAELSESKELVSLVKKSTTKELTEDEKELVKSQFKDVLKSVPSLAIFMIPGGAILLPLVLKVVPDLLPSAFQENQIEKEKDE